MKIGILVNEGPYNHQASDTALNFCKAALAKGHTIWRVFFYYDGVLNAAPRAEPPTDDRNLFKQWGELAEKHGVDLVVCVAAGLRRGIREGDTAPGFRISGLGQLIEAGIQCDRLVTFGD
ncbi:MAG: sulfurtransferase complex subunit TusD [Alphaproteobacteria bacterium]|nr:sulfurtransferase complex subunit TusD [Alphaproteobacteria bacterium]MBF0334234.1 sulfurtransferase complex subunit TusD [Alphaproteobacteria bacterium]MBF0372167.1 sulfurtransferase complex subunit TusD [Alphaproteobacteria bacterium]MBF0391414.1 sulfurtransferase complex subunit TusD [Alphaproteobacteria bacterium]